MKNTVLCLLIILTSLGAMLTGCSMDSQNTLQVSEIFNADNAATDLAIEEAYPGRKGELQSGYMDGQLIQYEVINGEWVFEGDIILDPELISREPARGAGRTSGKWSNRAVPYEIHSSFTNQQRVLDAVATYNRLGFNFFPRNGQSAYVRFIRSTDGNSSSVGRTGSRQDIKITDGASV